MISQGLTSLLWFALILALIPLALWLLKRTPMGGAAAHGILKSIGSLPLSASQRIVTIEVGHGDARRWLVLGVTPQNITTLHTMEPQADAASAAQQMAGSGAAPVLQPLSGFAQLFAKLRQDKGDTGAG